MAPQYFNPDQPSLAPLRGVLMPAAKNLPVEFSHAAQLPLSACLALNGYLQPQTRTARLFFYISSATATMQTEKLLSTLLALREEQTSLPDPHVLAESDEHVRHQYFTLLAMLLLSQSTLGAHQSRLFGLLLKAAGLADMQASILQAALDADEAKMREAIEAIKDEKAGATLLMDALVLARLDAVPSEPQQRAMAELAYQLDLDDATVCSLVDLASTVLGMAQPLLDASTRERLAAFDFETCKHWHTFIFEDLTAEKLLAGMHGGLWKLSQSISVNQGWSMESCFVVFNAHDYISLKTIAEEGAVSIQNCTWIDPLGVSFYGRLNVEVNHLNVIGEVDRTGFAMEIHSSPSAVFNDCRATAKGYQFLYAHASNLTMSRCTIHDCGSSSMNDRGAALVLNGSTTSVTECRFSENKSLCGSDVYFQGMNFFKAEKCVFQNARAYGVVDGGGAVRGSSVFCEYLSFEPGSMISNSVFDNSSAYGYFSNGNDDIAFKKCTAANFWLYNYTNVSITDCWINGSSTVSYVKGCGEQKNITLKK